MRTPEFWGKPGLVPELLLPASVLYFFYLRLRGLALRGKPYKAGVPVICVGNLTAGGAGKTPAVMALAAALKTKGKHVAILSRGYKRTASEPVRVDAARHTASDVGDEPLLLARLAATYVGADRAVTARMAEADGADVILMDDGLMHGRLHKDKTLLVIDGGYGFGNGLPLPAGPLRDMPKYVLPRCNAALVIGCDAVIASETKQSGPMPAGLPRSLDSLAMTDMPVFTARIQPQPAEPKKDTAYLAFAGIARPAKFFDTLARAGYEVKNCVAFPDHHPYTQRDVNGLRAKAAGLRARLITTEKDAVRLPEDFLRETDVLGITLEIEALPEVMKALCL